MLPSGRSGSDKSYVATGGVAQKQGRGVPAVSKDEKEKVREDGQEESLREMLRDVDRRERKQRPKLFLEHCAIWKM